MLSIGNTISQELNDQHDRDYKCYVDVTNLASRATVPATEEGEKYDAESVMCQQSTSMANKMKRQKYVIKSNKIGNDVGTKVNPEKADQNDMDQH